MPYRTRCPRAVPRPQSVAFPGNDRRSGRPVRWCQSVSERPCSWSCSLVQPRVAARRAGRSDSRALPRGRRVEETKAAFDVEPLGSRAGILGYHADDLPGLLETYVVAGPDSVTLRDRPGYRDLELARHPAHVLIPARAISLSNWNRFAAMLMGAAGRSAARLPSRASAARRHPPRTTRGTRRPNARTRGAIERCRRDDRARTEALAYTGMADRLRRNGPRALDTSRCGWRTITQAQWTGRR